jgi:CRISPR-associated protein Cmr2
MTNHLLLLSIGPVQSFIAQARKTQDLYAGSQLLSELIRIAMDELKTKYPEVDFIFPKPQDGKNISYPNRFIASIPEANKDNLKTLGKELKETVLTTFKNKFYIDAAREASIMIAQKDDYCRQLDGFLDINWVILPYDRDKPEDYKKQYKEIERTLGAVKNVRSFTQLEELGKKCSLCGERNVLFYHPTKGKNGNDKKPAHIQDDAITIKDNKLTSGEGLCAVCFTKRFYPNAESFPSTAEITLMQTLTKLKETPNYKTKLGAYENSFGNYFDDQLYYEENLSEKYFDKFGYKGSKGSEELKKDLKKIYDIAKKEDLKFNKYYAIIALDGDNMGKWLSGEYLDDERKKKLKDFHNQMSEKLGKYADQVKKEIFKDNEGALIYAGGDDVLAFVNLNHLTDVLKKLRQDFPKFEDISVDGKKVVKENQKSTASCGVAIAHYKIPLGEVLKRARKMEKAAKAKEKGDRNAFGIAVLKHSGEIEETVFKWGENQANIELLGNLVDHLKQEEFSNTFIKSLNTELFRLMDDEGKIDNPKADDIINIELQRLLERSRDKNKDITKEQAKQLAEKIYKLYESKSDDVQNFLSFLNIADFLHREVNK